MTVLNPAISYGQPKNQGAFNQHLNKIIPDRIEEKIVKMFIWCRPHNWQWPGQRSLMRI